MKKQRRKFVDAPQAERCEATVALKDGTSAQCGRYRKIGRFCRQHHKKLISWACGPEAQSK